MLIIDEAQHLPANVLKQLRLLTNLETRERKRLQINEPAACWRALAELTMGLGFIGQRKSSALP
jgi:hypothetical protein